MRMGLPPCLETLRSSSASDADNILPAGVSLLPRRAVGLGADWIYQAGGDQ